MSDAMNGYDGPYVVFDEQDGPTWLFAQMFPKPEDTSNCNYWLQWIDDSGDPADDIAKVAYDAEGLARAITQTVVELYGADVGNDDSIADETAEQAMVGARLKAADLKPGEQVQIDLPHGRLFFGRNA